MTLTATTTKVQYSGDASTTSFAVSFVFWDADDLRVVLTDSNDVETVWTRGTQYTVSGGDGSTGTVSVETSPTDYTPASGETLTIVSNLSDLQNTSLPLGGEFPSSSVEQQFDKTVRLVQQLSEEVGRAMLFPVSDADSNIGDFASIADRKGKTLGFNSSTGAPEVVEPSNSSPTEVTATGSTTARTLADRFADVVNVLDYGAAGDGATDDTGSFNTALALGKAVIVPEGTYKITGTLAMASGARLLGFGRGSILAFSSFPDNDSLITFAGTNAVEDLKITVTDPGTGTYTLMFVWATTCSDVVIRNNYLDMGVTESGGSLNIAGQLFSIPESGTQNNVLIENNYFTNFKFGILKTNTSTASNSNWIFRGNTFETFHSPAVTMNTPNGSCFNFQVTGNIFNNQNGPDSGNFGHCGGVAGSSTTNNVVFADNTISNAADGFHFEEGVQSVSITGNNIRVTANALELVDNYIGGTRLAPSGFTITGNTLVNTGGSPTGDGIQFQVQATKVSGTAAAGAATTITLEAGDQQADDFYNGQTIRITGGTGAGDTSRTITDYDNATNVATVNSSWDTTPDATSVYFIEGLAQLERSIISNNTIKNFAVGIDLGLKAQRIGVTDNYLDNCTTGISMTDVSGGVADNFFDGCTTGIDTGGGGLLGRQEFLNCTNPIATDNGRVSCTEMVFRFDLMDFPASTTNTIDIIALGANQLLDARASANYYASSTQYGANIVDLNWDGATLTSVNRAQTMATPNLSEAYTSGVVPVAEVDAGVNFSSQVYDVSGGNLRLRVVTGAVGIVENIEMTVVLQGIYITN